MNAQYRTVNQCLQLLKQSDVSTVKRLRVEIQLIQIKRLLLKENRLDHWQFGPCSEDSFNAVLGDLKQICTREGGGDDVSEVMQRIRGIIATLSAGDGMEGSRQS